LITQKNQIAQHRKFLNYAEKSKEKTATKNFDDIETQIEFRTKHFLLPYNYSLTDHTKKLSIFGEQRFGRNGRVRKKQNKACQRENLLVEKTQNLPDCFSPNLPPKKTMRQ
jgi:hypothetical protein